MNSDHNDIRIDLITNDSDKELQAVFETISEKVKLSLDNARKTHLKRIRQIRVDHRLRNL
ncbi:hypothetical protein XMV242_001495 [Marinobacterium sp. xm-v-242]|jgi:hypothetical protein|nr:hypothetical protein [Marinobacterium sp. xm-v-242]NRP77602.1 hypothetical protein [Marinobacterium sp. xm-m-383]